MSANTGSVDYEIFMREAHQQRSDEIALMVGSFIAWLKDRRTGKLHPGTHNSKDRHWAGIAPDLVLHTKS